ncbi:diphthine--ammonia ligase [Candidatus Woesearchaeota archaeon]|mgnify:CR=1 FL=1|jgi:diphthine-ammonia ligase|nr:diphthine--ammonia ligase [Candidatus Woesearchaeota archaeon]MBT6045004.1 diphthine--ammonia ligase [Candidatus Woesearchaeota archaeon]
MCGITGAINIKNHKEISSKALKRISYRGIDNKDSISNKNFTFSHCLHSVVGNKKQPLENKNFIFATNCEIYNWKELKTKHKLESQNDAELLFDLLNKQTIEKVLPQLDGVFSFVLHNKKTNATFLARDPLGIKPLWFHYNKHLIFASERKAIKEFEPEELNPRKIIIYKNKKLTFLNQDFFKINHKVTKIKPLLTKAIKKRIPSKDLGLLFSGGIDSTLLAHILKQNKTNFIAYMTVAETKSKEIDNAKKIAKKLNFKLKLVKINKEILKEHLPKIINLIETADPVKVEVGATMYFALKEAQKDNIKVIFSGIGADDIFGGYKRMSLAQDISLDSLSNLRRIYERDTYRDDVLSMAHNIELRLPYLDKKLVQACLNIPNENKTGETKTLLRKVARELKLPDELTKLKRNAAQYSSGISKLTSKLTKDTYKAKYFSKILKRKNLKLGSLLSTGKDSVYALHIQDRLNYDISCLITIDSKNKDSYMYHTPTINLAKKQAEALNLPIIIQKTEGKKEVELKELETAIKKAKEKYKIQGIITGALFSNYQRTRIEEICDKLNLKCFSPLWHMDQETEMNNLLKNNFKFIMTKIAAEGFDATWLGKTITKEHINKLINLNRKLQINIAGEGGEFETLVLDAPLFKKQLNIEKQTIQKDSKHSATLVINKVSLKKK